MIIRRCAVCGKEIKVSPSQEKGKKTCSGVCRSRFVKKARVYAGENNPAYKGGKVLDSNGYIRIRGKRSRKGSAEHRQVMTKFLGRELREGEEVHHINGMKADNRIENLFIVNKKEHAREHYQLFLKVQKLEWENKWLTDELVNYKEKFGEII